MSTSQNDDNLDEGFEDLDATADAPADEAPVTEDGGPLAAPTRNMSSGGGSKKNLIILGGLLAVLLLGGGGAYFFLMGGDDTPANPPVAMPAPAAPSEATFAANTDPAATPTDPAAADPAAAVAAPAPDALAAVPAADPGIAPPADPAAVPAMPPADPAAVPPVVDATAAVTPAPTATVPTVDASAATTVDAAAAAVTPPVETAAVAPPAPEEPADLGAPPAEEATATPLTTPAATTTSVTAPVTPAPAEPQPDLPMPEQAVTTPATTVTTTVTQPTGTTTVTTTATTPAGTTEPSEAELAIVQNAAILDQVTQPGTVSRPFDPAAPTPSQTNAIKEVDKLLQQQAIIRPLPPSWLQVKKNYDADDMDSRLTAARSALAQNRNAAALQLFTDLKLKYPKDSRVLMGRAVALQKMGQTDDALAAYEAVLNANPKNLQALTNMLGLLKSRDPQLAVAKLSELQQAYPYQPDITAQLGVALGQAGEYEKALRYLEMAEAMDPGSAYVIYNKAVLYDKMGQASAAGDLYRQLIRMSADGTLDENLPLEQIKRRLSVLH
jgi:Flp pilus assembly protein TadD